jgi:hypothetical protein
VLSNNKFCITQESGNYGWPSYKTYQVAVKARKNVVEVPAVGTGSCPSTSVAYETVDSGGCSGTVGYVDELTGANFGEEPYSKSSSEKEAVVRANGGWAWPAGKDPCGTLGYYCTYYRKQCPAYNYCREENG